MTPVERLRSRLELTVSPFYSYECLDVVLFKLSGDDLYVCVHFFDPGHAFSKPEEVNDLDPMNCV